VLGMDPQRDGDRLRRRIGAQLQSSALPDRLRVGEALWLFARGRDGAPSLEWLGRRWGLEGLWRRPFAKLSGGEQQRLFIALALVNRPEVVFFDELTTGLDPQARRATWDLVRRVRDDGATVVLVTHFMEEAEELCDRVAIVDRGRVVATGTPSELVRRADATQRVSFTWPSGWPRAWPAAGSPLTTSAPTTPAWRTCSWLSRSSCCTCCSTGSGRCPTPTSAESARPTSTCPPTRSARSPPPG
jgi:ABC-type multidrug transport system ATPase subunit